MSTDQTHSAVELTAAEELPAVVDTQLIRRFAAAVRPLFAARPTDERDYAIRYVLGEAMILIVPVLTVVAGLADREFGAVGLIAGVLVWLCAMAIAFLPSEGSG